MNKFAVTALTGAALSCFAGSAQAAVTLTATVSAAYTSNVPTADLHKTSPTTKEINDVKLSPQILKGTLSTNPGVPVEFFAYCVDIFQSAGAATFEVKTLADYLGNATKTAQITQLIAAEGAKENKLHDAAVQLAVWELINETQSTLDIDKMTTTTTSLVKGDKYWDWNTYSWKYKMVEKTTTTTTPNQFWADDVKNGSGVLGNADSFLAGAVADAAAGKSTAGYSLYVAKSNTKQDFLFWTYTPTLPPVTPSVPEPGTWCMMILGFGTVGFMIRHKRKVSAVTYA